MRKRGAGAGVYECRRTIKYSLVVYVYKRVRYNKEVPKMKSETEDSVICGREARARAANKENEINKSNESGRESTKYI